MNQLKQGTHRAELHSDLMKQTTVIRTALDQLFANEDSRVLKARRVLGDSVKATSDEELEIYITELQYMIDYWLDQFEREAFDGQTLRQLLKEG